MSWKNPGHQRHGKIKRSGAMGKAQGISVMEKVLGINAMEKEQGVSIKEKVRLRPDALIPPEALEGVHVHLAGCM